MFNVSRVSVYSVVGKNCTLDIFGASRKVVPEEIVHVFFFFFFFSTGDLSVTGN